MQLQLCKRYSLSDTPLPRPSASRKQREIAICEAQLAGGGAGRGRTGRGLPLRSDQRLHELTADATLEHRAYGPADLRRAATEPSLAIAIPGGVWNGRMPNGQFRPSWREREIQNSRCAVAQMATSSLQGAHTNHQNTHQKGKE